MHVTSYLHNLNANYNLTLSSVSPSSSYATVSVNSASLSDTFGYTLSESTDNQRFARFMNPVFKYDFKVGNYMTDDMKKMNPHLFTSIKDVTTGIRKSSWFTSSEYSNLFKSNVVNHLLYFKTDFNSSHDTKKLAALNSDLDSTFVLNAPHSTNVTFTGGFYNFFIILSDSSNSLNTR